MKITTRTRYGLRAMSELAAAYPDKVLSIKKISQRQGISEKYLEQIIAPLRGAKLIHGEPGARGGYRLTRNPAEISLLEVFRVLEGSVRLVSCLDEGENCARRDCCPTYRVWAELSQAIENTLAKRTLNDIAAHHAEFILA